MSSHSQPGVASRRPIALLELGRHRWLLWLIAVFFLSTWAAALVAREPFLPFLTTYLERVVRSLALLVSAGLLVLCVKALLQANRRPVAETIANACRQALRSRFLWRYLFASLTLGLFMAAFLYNKMRIPDIVGFQWDRAFAEFDYLIFGDHPWRLLQPIFGYPAITVVLDLLYSLWVPLVFLFWSGLFASRRIDPDLCRRFWMATVVSWLVLGLGLATLLSSAGPVYFDAVLPQIMSPYAGLERYLAEIDRVFPLSSTLTKDYLWAIHAGNLDAPGGISAMPSMHNAQCALFAAAAYSIDRRFGHVMLAYALAIFFGSIHLGWHYAMDGIVGVAGALAIWFAIGKAGSRQPHFATA